MSKTKADKITSALRKKAVGYTSNETVEEYALCEGEMTLVKRKVKYTDVPPDISAVRLMLEIGSVNETEMTEEEIKKEKQRLIGLLLEVENATNKNEKQV